MLGWDRALADRVGFKHDPAEAKRLLEHAGYKLGANGIYEKDGKPLAIVPAFARTIRGSTLVVRETLYVEAARAIGGSTAGILSRHVVPNVLPPLVVLVTLAFPAALLSAAALGFVGLGAQPPVPEWGAMLVGARTSIRRAPWMDIPGLAIVITVLGFNLLGNALRDVLDPAERRA